jgi:hypothetical protein
MEQYAIVFQVLLVLLVLFFGFITYMNTKTWKWVHVTFLLLVFFAAPTFGVYAALTMKTRFAWMKWVQEHADEVDKVQKSVALLQRGEPDDIKAERDAVFTRREELSRLIMDRGRVWRNCTPTVQGGAVTLQVPVAAAPAPPPPAPMPMPMPMPADPAQPVDPAAQPMPMPMPEPAAPAGGHNIAAKTVVYVFEEFDARELGFKVPQFYLGEFWVTATSDTTVTLAPTMPLAPDQMARVTQPGQATWMLFETCPIDTHEIYAGLDAATIGTFIPAAETGLAADAYAALINTIVQDGQRAPENTPPENLWTEVEFLKAHKEEVDAAGDPNNAADASPFDSTGLAQPIRLRRQETDLAEFETGDVAIIPTERADELVAQGIVKKGQPIYRRKLIEFSARLRTIYRRKFELDLFTKEINRDIATLQAANQKAEEQITLENEHKRQLTEDIAKVTFERDGVNTYKGELESKIAQTNNEIRALYASTRALNIELRKLTADATEEADRRTREATAAATRP